MSPDKRIDGNLTGDRIDGNDGNDRDPLADLRRELSAVSPSPSFAAGVRERIEKEDAARAGRWFDWRGLVGVAAAAAVIVGIVVIQRQGGPALEPTSAPVTQTASAQPQAPTPSSATPAVTPIAPVATAAARTASLRPAVLAHVIESREPALEVITTQPAILKAMWAQFNASARATTVGAELPTEVRDVVVAPVEVEPVIVKWLVEPPITPGVLPIIRRVSAEMAERSAK